MIKRFDRPLCFKNIAKEHSKKEKAVQTVYTQGNT